MITPEPWFARTFAFDLQTDQFPLIVERLRGTPARLEERLSTIAPAILTAQPDGRWSIQENVGHLLDLEPLWYGRIDDILAGVEVMRAADLSNTATHEADHNATPMPALLTAFRDARAQFVARLDALDADAVMAAALHPRLRQPMRVLDLAFFVAEHDDHHLATISYLLRSKS